MSEVLVSPTALQELVDRAVAELERSGRRVNYQNLADFLDMSQYVLRKLVCLVDVDLQEAAR